jgi:F-type H+-transporting ATPase subunit b
MLIDWFTVAAQILNFIILIWLMKRFLYKPILDAIDAREKKIAAQLKDAEAKKAEARIERDEFESKNDAFDQQRDDLLAQATAEAKAEGQRLMEEARKAADAMSVKRLETLRSDAQNLNQAIMLRTGQEVFAIARKTLIDLAGTSLEERMSEVFCNRVRELDSETKASLTGSISTASEPARVRSAFELPEDGRSAIQKALKDTFSADIPVRFEIEPELVSGLELIMGGQKVAWSIADHLTTLGKGVEELLQDKRMPMETNLESKSQ